jgi:phosphotriesterase-related protein
MTAIETVRGPIQPEQLGTVLMHEHLFAKNPELEQNYPHPEWDEAAMVQKAIDRLNALKQKGIDTFVDLTVLGLGRFIPRVQQVAAGTEMTIVVATGCYITNGLPTYFHTHGPGRTIDEPEPLEAFFRKDITEGVADTGVRAAVLKVIADHEALTSDEERIMTAAAHVQAETGVLIMTHSNAGLRNGLLQQQLFRQLGVDLTRVVIGHCGDTTDLDYLRELLDSGSSIGLDRFGMETVLSDEERTKVLIQLLELGYADQLVISHDAGIFSVNTPPSWRAANNPYWNHFDISDRIVPRLLESGIGQDLVDQMLRRNPVRLLTPAA